MNGLILYDVNVLWSSRNLSKLPNFSKETDNRYSTVSPGSTPANGQIAEPGVRKHQNHADTSHNIAWIISFHFSSALAEHGYLRNALLSLAYIQTFWTPQTFIARHFLVFDWKYEQLFSLIVQCENFWSIHYSLQDWLTNYNTERTIVKYRETMCTDLSSNQVIDVCLVFYYHSLFLKGTRHVVCLFFSYSEIFFDLLITTQ